MFILILDATAIYNTQQNSEHQTEDREGYVISHTEFPQDYTPNIDSSLSINDLHPLQLVWIRFVYFDLYTGCSRDYLEITGLQDDNMKFCSSSKAPVLDTWYALTVSQSSLTTRFKTNSNEDSVKTGFFFQYVGEWVFNNLIIINKFCNQYLFH